jgi:para-nitrobenzyl esterase
MTEWPREPIVHTATGRLRGEAGPEGFVFRGVPYAAPPSGLQRFRAPEPAAPWAGVRDALEFGPAPPQRRIPWLANLLPGLGSGAQSEDCLSLNVWTPGLDDRARRPVMVWLHGGGFTIGSGTEPWYDGRRLSQRGEVVVVTVNYRLGMFGSLCGSEVLGAGWDGAANCGLRDQIAALEWVRENIEGFGGDPANVTVFGESAGAMSVSALLACPAAQGLFRRAIAQSGAAHNVSPAEFAARVAERLLQRLELRPADAHRLAELPVDQLLTAQLGVELESWADPAGHHLPFAPTVDGALLPRAPLAAIAEGSAADVDLLVGTNRDEWNLFQFLDPELGVLDDAGFVRRCEALLTVDGDALARAYRAAHPEATPWTRWLVLRTDWTFRIPARRLAEAQARHRPDTYSYLFTWASAALGGDLGACHALELPFVFDTHHVGTTSAFTGTGPEVQRLTALIQEAWLAFARTGSPAHADLGEWPGVASSDDGRLRTMVLDAECRVTVDDESGPDLQFWRNRR